MRPCRRPSSGVVGQHQRSTVNAGPAWSMGLRARRTRARPDAGCGIRRRRERRPPAPRARAVRVFIAADQPDHVELDVGSELLARRSRRSPGRALRRSAYATRVPGSMSRQARAAPAGAVAPGGPTCGEGPPPCGPCSGRAFRSAGGRGDEGPGPGTRRPPRRARRRFPAQERHGDLAADLAARVRGPARLGETCSSAASGGRPGRRARCRRPRRAPARPCVRRGRGRPRGSRCTARPAARSDSRPRRTASSMSGIVVSTPGGRTGSPRCRPRPSAPGSRARGRWRAARSLPARSCSQSPAAAGAGRAGGVNFRVGPCDDVGLVEQEVLRAGLDVEARAAGALARASSTTSGWLACARSRARP